MIVSQGCTKLNKIGPFSMVRDTNTNTRLFFFFFDFHFYCGQMPRGDVEGSRDKLLNPLFTKTSYSITISVST